MKAEHRKELQTNALADRMGRFIKGIKQRPSRGSFLTWLLVILVVAGVAFYVWRRSAAKEQESKLWQRFGLRDAPLGKDKEGNLVYNYDVLMEGHPNTPQGRAAAVQKAWYFLHNRGIERLLAEPLFALQSIRHADKLYTALAEKVKDDPVLAPEVKYALAVIAETLAADPLHSDLKSQLEKAASLYNGVAEDYGRNGSAHAKQARQRHKELTTPARREEIERFYVALRRKLDPTQRNRQDLFRNLPPEWQEKLRKS